MQAYHIEDIRKFTKYLFDSEKFDDYQMSEVSILTFCQFKINGKNIREFYTNDEWEIGKEDSEYVFWKNIRSLCFQIIKGKKPPVSFRIVLKLNKKQKQNWFIRILEENLQNSISELYLNILYKDRKLILISACSYMDFTLDKSIEQYWDKEVEKLLKELEVVYAMQ